MEIRDLDYFLHVASCGHVGRAAEKLGLTQPALTKSIARLERDVNAELFRRTPHGMELTPVGEQLVAHAKRLRCAIDEVRRELSDLAAGETGSLRIGSGVSVAQHLLPIACTVLLQSSPRLAIDIATGTGQRLISALREGQLDVVVSGLAEQPAPGLKHELIMQDEVLVLARRSHPLHRAPHITLEELGRHEWVLSRSESLVADWLSSQYRAAGLRPPRARVETDSLTTQLAIVANSDLLAFQSWTTIHHSPLQQAVKPLAGSPLVWRRPVGVTCRADGYFPAAAAKLIQILKVAAAAPGGTRRSAA